MTQETDVLFVKYDLRAVLEAHEREMLGKVDAIGQDELLGIDVEQLCDYYEAEYRVEVPRLDESAVTVDQRETQIDVSQDPRRVILVGAQRLVSRAVNSYPRPCGGSRGQASAGSEPL